MANESETITFLSEVEREKYLSLKEAAMLTDYSPDYIGQLIRAGKIEGRQVYTNVSWVTTEKAVRTYMETRGRSTIESNQEGRDPRNYLRYTLYGVITCLGFILLVCAYIFFVGVDRALTNVSTKTTTIEGYE
jgi:hypothetical protein